MVHISFLFKMNNHLLRLMGTARKSWNRCPNVSPLTYSVICYQLKHKSSSACKYAVYEPNSKRDYLAESSKLETNKMQNTNELSLTALRLMNNSQHDYCSLNIMEPIKIKNTDVTSETMKQRLENLTLDVDETLTEMFTSNLEEQVDLPTDEHLDDIDYVESEAFLSDFNSTTLSKPNPLLGTEDRKVQPSKIPCVGCGAPLQCQHKTFPGFLPSEYFKILTEIEMKTTLCQRCYYIRHCNAFQEVSANPKEFAEMIAKIRPTKSAVLMVVDVMDIHGSIIPNLMDLIGGKHPIIVVGNKADLLSPDCSEFLKNVNSQLLQACYVAGLRNIKKCTLISAKTGFGIERLIDILFSLYKRQVDVYIVGTANAGKSSLFNILLASDYCKHTARDLIERATISVWPGTTLNMLKFPIMRPSSRTIALRVKRLKQEQAQRLEHKKLQKERNKEDKEKKISWELKDEVCATDTRTESQFKADETGEAWGQKIIGYKGTQDGSIKLVRSSLLKTPFNSEELSDSYWAYDTPGVINPNQIMNLLTPEETPYLAPTTMIVPQSLIFRPGETVFVSGLGRLDYMQGNESVILTVHCGPKLPIHVIATKDADEFYLENLGTERFGIPMGNKDRLMRLPSLVGREFSVEGIKPSLAVADVQLSSLGWISVSPNEGQTVKMTAYTPGGRGLHLRTPSLMPNHSQFSGKRIAGTPFYATRPPGWVMARRDDNVVIDS
ncbi:unnamed protein product [Lymnaea stagnalis]|uniref:Nitric oxide-associated protein 1 n=1 Tax=Lymnaea stagnalis TaxID=6523 RepID=A0AAV2HW51_LYMST